MKFMMVDGSEAVSFYPNVAQRIASPAVARQHGRFVTAVGAQPGMATIPSIVNTSQTQMVAMRPTGYGAIPNPLERVS